MVALIVLGILATWVVVSSTVAGYTKWTHQDILKTINTAALAAFMFGFVAANSNVVALVVAIGLTLAAVGDFCLNYPVSTLKNTFFAVGMVAFMVSYLTMALYVQITLGLSWITLIVLLVWVTVGIFQYVTMSSVLLKGLEIPIAVYLVVATICATVGTMLLIKGSIFGGIGFLLLYVSDSAIGQNLFRKPFAWAELVITPTYVLGLVGIMLFAIL
jgi:hypothetical protein